MTVTPEVVATVLGRTAPAYGSVESDQWALWIGDATMLIEARLGDLALLDQVKLDYVVREAVAAHVRKPDDATQVTISVDDASTSRTYRSSAGRVVILDEWWQLLSPTTAGGAFAVDTVLMAGGAVHADWCSINFGALYCSCGAVLTQNLPLYGN